MFLKCQGQQEFGISANLSTPEQCRMIYKKTKSDPRKVALM